MDLRALALAAALAAAPLAGCGFQPLYGSRTTVAALSQVEVASIAGRTGFLLREQLDDELARDRTTPARFRLEAAVKEGRYPVGGRVNNIANRYGLGLSVDYRLSEIATQKELRRGTVSLQVSYDSSDPPYAGVAAQQNAEERAANQAAILLRLELARYFTGLIPKS